jgi:hypothetical protein
MFLQLGEIGMICDPANVMTNPESVVAVMWSKFSSVFADLKAAGEAVQMGANLSMEESTKSALAEMRKSNRTTIPRPSILVTPSQSRSTGKQTKCEILLGGRVEDCTASRQSLMKSLTKASTAQEQLEILALLLADNSLFQRLWDKEYSVPPVEDTLKTCHLCSKCKPFYNEKFASILNCYLNLCEGDLARLASYHPEKFVGGKLVLGKFKSKCRHAIVPLV